MTRWEQVGFWMYVTMAALCAAILVAAVISAVLT
jgi:hypothetical protein